MDFFQHYRQSAVAHFDVPRSTTELQQYITNPDKVAKHAFYPFIVKTQGLIKVKRQGEKLKRYKKSDLSVFQPTSIEPFTLIMRINCPHCMKRSCSNWVFPPIFWHFVRLIRKTRILP